VFTAHHADDNAETMLLNLLRGTGLRGLAGIPETRGAIVRPFLSVTRAELVAYAKTNKIDYVEDSTNALDDVSRNLLRHKVLPVLRELNPRAVENMLRTAEMLRRDEETLDRMAAALLEQSCRFAENTAVLDVAGCLKAEDAVLSRAVHRAIARLAGGRKDITARHVEAVCALLRGPAGKEFSLPYGLTVRREEQELILSPAEAVPTAVSVAVGETVAFGNWRVAVKESGPGLEMKIPEGAVLTATLWDRNDRMTIPGSRGARSLKRLCVDSHIAPGERNALPVLRVDGRCAAVPGIGIDREYLSCGRTVYVTFIKETEEKRYGT
jgi:tRNA(Ile)-lysidine synthase